MAVYPQTTILISNTENRDNKHIIVGNIKKYIFIMLIYVHAVWKLVV